MPGLFFTMQFLRMDVESVEYLCQFPEIDYEIYSSPELRLVYLLLFRDTGSEKNDFASLYNSFKNLPDAIIGETEGDICLNISGYPFL